MPVNVSAETGTVVAERDMPHELCVYEPLKVPFEHVRVSTAHWLPVGTELSRNAVTVWPSTTVWPLKVHDCRSTDCEDVCVTNGCVLVNGMKDGASGADGVGVTVVGVVGVEGVGVIADVGVLVVVDGAGADDAVGAEQTFAIFARVAGPTCP